MLARIRRLLAPPVFEGDADKTRAAWLLNVILLTLLARAVFIRLTTGADPPRLSLFVPFVLLLAGMLVVMRRGRIRLASVITVAGFWLSLTAAAVATGGLYSVGFRNYILPVIVAGLLLKRGAALFTAGVSIVAGLAMWAAGTSGMPGAAAQSARPEELLITHSISLLMAAVLVTLATGRIEEALADARREIAERQRAEIERRLSEERFSKAFELSPLRMGIVRIKDGVVLDVNACWERDTGFARGHVVGQPILKMTELIGKSGPRIRALLDDAKPARDLEMSFTAKGGEERLALVSVEPIELGGERCLLWVTSDITERKRAERALRESEETFRTAFESATAGVCVVGADGGFLRVNRTLCEMLGYSAEELARMSFEQVTHEEDKHIGGAFVVRALAGYGSHAQFEKRYIHKDGHVIWAYVSSALIDHPAGNRRCFITYVQDITERKRAETERLALTHDLGERIKELTALHRTARLLQEDRPFNEELLSTLAALLPPAWQHPAVCEARISYGDIDARTPGWIETPWMQSEEFVTSRGGRGTIAIAYREERPEAGEGPFLIEERRLIQSLADMLGAHLERKHAEDEIRTSSEQLRALMVSLRSAKEEEGVRIAREIHDELGSALTGLRWDLEELDRAVSGTEVLPSAVALKEKTARMFGLIDATIDVVRRISSELRPSILDDLGLAAAVEWQAQQFQARTGIPCRYNCSAEHPDLDPEQSIAVFRIFQEALTNVLRHAQATAIDVLLEEEGDEFILRIRDNGKGIRSEETSGQFSLGLLGMRERAQLIGARIEFAGTESKGTTVTLHVPRRLSARATTATS
jgi:PAS domain S-box-containing protein